MGDAHESRAFRDLTTMDYVVKLANALAVRGLMTVDLRTVQRTPFVPLSLAVETAKSTYTAGSDPAWTVITSHILTLKVMGVSTVAIKNDGPVMRFVVLRPSPDGILDIPEAVSFLAALDQWAEQMTTLLPEFRLTPEQEETFEAASSWVGRYTGQDAVKWAVSKLLFMFARASGAGSCIVVNPVTSTTDAYRALWDAADLQKEHLVTGHMHTASYLWTLNDGRVQPGNSPNVSWNYEPDPNDLHTALMNVTDQ